MTRTIRAVLRLLVVAFTLAASRVAMGGPDVCPGDCGGDGSVTVNEVVTLVRIALQQAPVTQCSAGDVDGNGQITVDEIVLAVRAVLIGCPLPTPPLNGATPTPSATSTATSTPTVLPVVFLGPCAPPAVPGQTLVANISTGQGVTSAGLPDPFWRFVPPPPIPPTGPIPFTTTPHSAWVSAPAGSWWIQPSSSGSPSGGPSAGYEVQVLIMPPLSQYSALRVVGQYAADNTVQSVQLNGTVIGACTPSTSNCFSSFQPVNFTAAAPTFAPFVGGVNTLHFTVNNISNVTGLLVNARVEADCPPATPTYTRAPTLTPTPSRTLTRTATPTHTPSPSRTPSMSPTTTNTPAPTRTRTSTRTATPTTTATPSFSPRPTLTASATHTRTTTLTATSTRTVTATGAALTATPTPTCVGLPVGSVAWWPLDDPNAATAVLDIGGGGHHGVPQPGPVNNTFTAGPLTIPGQIATALYFFSGNEFVEVPHSSAFDLANTDLTIDAWFAAFRPGGPNFGGVPNWSAGQNVYFAIVDKVDTSTNTGYGLFLRTFANPVPPTPIPNGFPVTVSVELCFFQGNSGICAPFYTGTSLYDASTLQFLPPSPPWPYAGQWLHVAITVDRGAGFGQLYLNGTPFGSSFSVGPGVGNNTLPVWIGKSRLINNGFEFSLDEIEVFDRALAAHEIAALAGSGGKCKTPTPARPSPTRTPTSTATLPPTRTATPTLSPTAEGECRFVGPRMCGGSCPNPNEICMPKPDDSGCQCVPVEPPPHTATATPECPGAICTATPTLTSTPRPSNTPTHTQVPTSTPSRTATVVLELTFTPTRTHTPTPRPSNTPTRSATATATRTSTASPRPTATATRTPCFGEVCVTKFWDLNGNGQNDGEPGLGGWQVQFYDANNTLVSTVVTGPSGTMCSGIPGGGSYTVQEVLQGGCVQTYPPPPGTHSIFVECGQLLNIQFGNRCPFPTMTATPSRTATYTPTRTRTPTRTATPFGGPID